MISWPSLIWTEALVGRERHRPKGRVAEAIAPHLLPRTGGRAMESQSLSPNLTLIVVPYTREAGTDVADAFGRMAPTPCSQRTSIRIGLPLRVGRSRRT